MTRSACRQSPVAPGATVTLVLVRVTFCGCESVKAAFTTVPAAPVAVDGVVGHEPARQVERVGNRTGFVGGDVDVAAPGAAPVVVDEDVDGLARLPAGAGERDELTRGVVRLVARDRREPRQARDRTVSSSGRARSSDLPAAPACRQASARPSDPGSDRPAAQPSATDRATLSDPASAVGSSDGDGSAGAVGLADGSGDGSAASTPAGAIASATMRAIWRATRDRVTVADIFNPAR